MKKWLKITVVTSPAVCDSLADFAIGAMGGAVETEIVDEHTTGVVRLYFEKENPSEEDIDATLRQLGEYVDELAVIFKCERAKITQELIEEEDWGKKWKEHFTPFFITPTTVIAPTWEEYVPAGDEKVIVMDPGMAFGTGHHATTSLALEMVEKRQFGWVKMMWF